MGKNKIVKNLLFWKKQLFNCGVTLVEVIISVTIFAMLSLAIYYTMGFILRIELSAKAKVLASNIAIKELEVVRNMTYDDIGTVSGSPAGNLPQSKTVVSDNVSFNVSFSVWNVDDSLDGLAGPDTNPEDYKQVQAIVDCASCVDFQPVKMTTTIAPKGIEGAGTHGFLFVQVLNAKGQPVPDASVSIRSVTLSPERIIEGPTIVTDSNGSLKILDIDPAVEEYHIVVTKPGYSSDYTVTPGPGNQNPLNPDATIELGVVTLANFAIDLVANLNIASIGENCLPVGPVNFEIHGTKNLAKSPDIVYKYSSTFSTSSAASGGVAAINNLEWDTYTINVVAGQGYDIAGFIPMPPVTIAPGSAYNLKIILTEHILNKNSLLVSVKDGSSLLPLTGIEVKLYEGNSGWEYLPHPITGQGYFLQTDWTGPSGQQDFSADETGYWFTDGNLNFTSNGEIKLKKFGPDYALSGELISSTFDTGSSGISFVKMNWSPISQPAQVGASSVKFQIATSDTNDADTIWNFTGWDGTSGTYYDEFNQNINPASNGFQYVRYKVILSTGDVSQTPSSSDIAVSFNSGCTPPGQVLFKGLSNGNYSIDAIDTNGLYQSFSGTVNVTDETKYEILMYP